MFGGSIYIRVKADLIDRFGISNLFIAQVDIERLFYGTILRGADSEEHPVSRDRIKVNNGFVCAMAGHQDELGEKLDELVLMSLDYDLNSIPSTDFPESPT